MATKVIKQTEVSLYGVRYPIDGEVTEQSIPNFAPKTVFGDATRSDQQMVSQFIMNDWRDGLGDYEYDERDGVSTFYESTAETRLKGELRLPRKQIISTDLGATPVAMRTWGTADYVAAGSIIYKLNDATAFIPFGTAPAAITDMAVYKNNLFAACGQSGYWYHTGSAPGTVTAATAYYWAEYDNKLISLSGDADTGIHMLKSAVSATPQAGDWTDNAIVPRAGGMGSGRGLGIYANSEGKDAIYVRSRWGIAVVDFATQAVYNPMAFEFADGHTHNNRGFAVSRGGGELFISVKGVVYRVSGQNVYPMTVGGEPPLRINLGIKPWLTGGVGSGSLAGGSDDTFTISPRTSTYQGIVKFLLSLDRHIVAVLDRQDSSTGTSFVLAWNGRGWHTLASAAASMSLAHYSQSTYLGSVLWFNRGNVMYYITQPDVSDNPLMYTDTNAEDSALHTTGWFDANFSEIDKLAVELSLRKRNAGGSIIVSYGLDYNTAFTAFGTVTFAGATAMAFNSQAGTVFRSIRFQYDIRGGGAVDPIMEHASLKYALVPDDLSAWRFTVDCSRTYLDRTPAELLTALKAAKSTKTLGEFTFRPNDSHYVRIAQLAGKELSGERAEGKYDVLVATLT